MHGCPYIYSSQPWRLHNICTFIVQKLDNNKTSYKLRNIPRNPNFHPDFCYKRTIKYKVEKIIAVYKHQPLQKIKQWYYSYLRCDLSWELSEKILVCW